MNITSQGLSSNRWVASCQLIFMLDVFAMANGWFALSNTLELCLVCIVLSVSFIRRALFSLSDLRVFVLMAFLGWIALAMLWGKATYDVRFDELVSWRKILLFPIALTLFDTKQSKLLMVKTFVIWVFAYCLVSWLLFITDAFSPIHPADLLENDVVQSIFFSFAALCIFVLWSNGELIEKTAIWVLMFLILTSNIFIVGLGRSGYLFFAISLTVVVWRTMPNYRVFSSLGVLSAIAVALSVFEGPATLITQGVNEVLSYQETNAEYSSMGIRLVMWENTLKVIGSAPFLGSGSGSYYLSYADVVLNENGWRAEVVDDPHNQYLHLWAEQGLPAVLLLLSFLAVCFFSAPDGPFGTLALALVSGIAATSVFNGHFSTFVEGRLFWIMLGVCLAGSSVPVKAPLSNMFQKIEK